jgi:hypothetical protein
MSPEALTATRRLGPRSAPFRSAATHRVRLAWPRASRANGQPSRQARQRRAPVRGYGRTVSDSLGTSCRSSSGFGAPDRGVESCAELDVVHHSAGLEVRFAPRDQQIADREVWSRHLPRVDFRRLGMSLEPSWRALASVVTQVPAKRAPLRAAGRTPRSRKNALGRSLVQSR